jgi:hypothetical protein
MKHFIVQSACAQMPASVKAPYKRIAVLEVEPGVTDERKITLATALQIAIDESRRKALDRREQEQAHIKRLEAEVKKITARVKKLLEGKRPSPSSKPSLPSARRRLARTEKARRQS